jgi:hypothetical protein
VTGLLAFSNVSCLSRRALLNTRWEYSSVVSISTACPCRSLCGRPAARERTVEHRYIRSPNTKHFHHNQSTAKQLCFPRSDYLSHVSVRACRETCHGPVHPPSLLLDRGKAEGSTRPGLSAWGVDSESVSLSNVSPWSRLRLRSILGPNRRFQN